MKIQITIRNVYGNEQAYPVCDAAKLFAEIAGSKTLTPHTLNRVKRLGYQIEVVALGHAGSRMTDPISARIAFSYEGRRWYAQQWPTSDPRMPRLWQYKPKHRELALPTLDQYRAARVYFERMMAGETV